MSLLSGVMTGGLGALIVAGDSSHLFRAPVLVSGIPAVYRQTPWRVLIRVSKYARTDETPNPPWGSWFLTLECLARNGDQPSWEHGETYGEYGITRFPYWAEEGRIVKPNQVWRFVQQLMQAGTATYKGTFPEQGTAYVQLKNEKDKELLAVWLDRMMEQGALTP